MTIQAPTGRNGAAAVATLTIIPFRGVTGGVFAVITAVLFAAFGFATATRKIAGPNKLHSASNFWWGQNNEKIKKMQSYKRMAQNL